MNTPEHSQRPETSFDEFLHQVFKMAEKSDGTERVLLPGGNHSLVTLFGFDLMNEGFQGVMLTGVFVDTSPSGDTSDPYRGSARVPRSGQPMVSVLGRPTTEA